MKNFDALLGWLAARLSEPSTYVGLGLLLTAMHLSVPAGLTQSISYIGIGVGGVLGIILKEKGFSPAKTEMTPDVVVGNPAVGAI